MNKQEIEEMMRHLPSQQREETFAEKFFGGLAFVLFLVMICLL